MTSAEAFDIVKEELESGVENDPELRSMTATEIAHDMLAYSSAVEDWDFNFLVSVIVQVQAEGF